MVFNLQMIYSLFSVSLHVEEGLLGLFLPVVVLVVKNHAWGFQVVWEDRKSLVLGLVHVFPDWPVRARQVHFFVCLREFYHFIYFRVLKED